MCALDEFTFRLLLFALDVVWAGWCVNFYLFIYFKLCVFSSPLNNGSVAVLSTKASPFIHIIAIKASCVVFF